MAVIYDTAILRPDVGVHQLFPPAGATRGLRVPTINGIAAPPVRRNLLEARWAVAGDGHLACAWVRTSRAEQTQAPEPAPVPAVLAVAAR